MMRQGVRSALRFPSSIVPPIARRQAVVTGVAARRAASSEAGHASTAAHTKAAVKSDAPWAITSFLVFGSLFIYVTSPPSANAGDHGHGKKDDKHAVAEDDDDEAEEEDDGDEEAEEPEELTEEEKENDPYENVRKIEGKPGANASSGAKAIAERSMTAEEGAHLQKTSEKGKQRQKPDDTTFQKAVQAAKEGHSDPEKTGSDPKKVVAAAHTQRQDKKASEDAQAKAKAKEEDEDSEDFTWEEEDGEDQ